MTCLTVPSCLGWCELFFFFCRLIPTYYEIDKDGGRTHHAGVFHSGPISLQLPVLHMQSSQSVSQSVSQQHELVGLEAA